MLQHHQRFASVQRNRELGRQLVEARMRFQRRENPRCQRPGIEQTLRIQAGHRAEHQVAYVVAVGIVRAETCVHEDTDQPIVVIAYATNLQVGAVGGFDHALCISQCRVSHSLRLRGQQHPAGQFDPADATVQRRDDTQQPRTGRGA